MVFIGLWFLKNSERIRKREKNLIPIVVVNKDEFNRIVSSIRHNRARGSHVIELMFNIVSDLVKLGMSDEWIMKNVGMDSDELLRLKQINGVAALFRDTNFSRAWDNYKN